MNRRNFLAALAAMFLPATAFAKPKLRSAQTAVKLAIDYILANDDTRAGRACLRLLKLKIIGAKYLR